MKARFSVSTQHERRCIAFRHWAAHDKLWMPCTKPVDAGDVFCRRHREAANEIALGLASARPEPSKEHYRQMLSEAASMLAQWVVKRRRASLRPGREV